MSVNVEDRKVDLRVTTLPTQRGEGAHDPHPRHGAGAAIARRARHGRRAAGALRERVPPAYGAVLVTGPTGSGKSTTLYAALTELNAVEKNIVTIEDPVEYRIDGDQPDQRQPQGRARPSPPGLRSILRADPDMIMVGEIRDAETARIAIEAALTGHMVLTTLHTNDAPGTIARLRRWGSRRFLTASALDCVVAQRLARKLCAHCKRACRDPARGAARGRFPRQHRPRGLRAHRLWPLQADRLPREGSASSR